MSNTTKNLKKRLHAPRELVSATKRGERVIPKHTTDTNATHIRRFSKAFAAYACAAAVLVGGSIALPALLSDSSTPLTQPSAGDADQSPPVKPIETDGYRSLSAEQAENYIRPDLIWANELNPELKNSVIWSAENVDGESSVTQALTLPAVGGEDAEYAVEIRMEIIDYKAVHASHLYMARVMPQIESELAQIGFEKVNILPADSSVPNSNFAASRAELSAVDTEALLSVMNRADGDIRFVLRMAWQSLDGSQTPDNIFLNGSSMDFVGLGLDHYVYTDKEDYLRPDLVWANEDNRHCVNTPLFAANRWSSGVEDYSLLENSKNITGYTFAVDVQLGFLYEGSPRGEDSIVTGLDEAKLVEKALGWKPIVAGESYEATCEQLMALNDAEIIPAFAEAYEELYGVDADSIPTITILIDIAWQSVE